MEGVTGKKSNTNNHNHNFDGGCVRHRIILEQDLSRDGKSAVKHLVTYLQSMMLLCLIWIQTHNTR